MAALGFAVSASLHGVGHAALALAGGGCALALQQGAGGGSLLAPRSVGALFGHRFHGDALAFAFVGLAAVALKAAGGMWASWEQARLTGDVGNALRLRALDGWLALHRLRAPRHADQGAAQNETDHAAGRPLAPMYALTALTSHVKELETGIGAGVLGALRAVLQIVPLALALVWMAPGLAAVAGLVLVAFSFLLGRARRAWKRANERAARHRELLLEAADEAVRHAELWTTYGAEPRVRAHLEGVGRALAAQGARIDASAAALGGANEVLGALALVLAIVASRAGWLGAVGDGFVLLPFAVTFFLAYRPIRDLTDARLALARARVAAEAMAPLFELPREEAAPTESSSPGALPTWPLATLEVDGLRLARGLAQEVTATIPAGSILAIVGATGSGKTTLLRTLLGLEPARGGTLRYGGVRLEACASGPTSRPFAWVPQDAPLLADTLDANVALAPGSTDPALALEAIGATSLAERAGASLLGPAGRPLSGGERQRVSIARAVATRLPVLLLDEPTSGLDSAAQARVLQAIARLKGRRTVVLVTHREEPLSVADAVLRLGDAAAPVSGSRRASA
jgi:ABC-type transport system involved in cytochrome bd biosynthesis fused ATPase/permease subunit